MINIILSRAVEGHGGVAGDGDSAAVHVLRVRDRAQGLGSRGPQDHHAGQLPLRKRAVEVG